MNKKGTRKFILNLNQYRNAHFHTTNPAKVKFKEVMQSQLVQLPCFEVIELTYRIFHRNKGRFDLCNPGAILDKFFCDALVEAGKLPDDDYTHLRRVEFIFGGVDPTNPRCEVIITPIAFSKETPMQLSLNSADIRAAILAHVEETINLREGQEIVLGDVHVGDSIDDLRIDVNIQAIGEGDNASTGTSIKTAVAASKGRRGSRKAAEAKTEAPKVDATAAAPVVATAADAAAAPFVPDNAPAPTQATGSGPALFQSQPQAAAPVQQTAPAAEAAAQAGGTGPALFQQAAAIPPASGGAPVASGTAPIANGEEAPRALFGNFTPVQNA